MVEDMKKETVSQRRFYLIDAQGKVLGRLATRIADILRGKHKPDFAPHQDKGDYVIVINAEKVRVTGKKRESKVYRHYSGYPGGLKEETFAQLLARKPERIIMLAVKGMLPKNKLARRMIRRLKVYRGNTHPHLAQKPTEIEIAHK
ncbi:MAG: 50S ribosomal protein L13 [Candidatus Omnitrophota bacterium]|nr:MAG: 50S ribosomal protein L13 [Candidatus Omnitrophota bacterium]